MRSVQPIAVVGVDDVDVHQRLLGEVAEEEDGGEAEHAGVARRSEREPTGLARFQEKGLRCSERERFGQDEEAVEAIEEAESRRRPRRAGAG